MEHPTNQPPDPHPRLKEYEDPHYHDADEVEIGDDGETRKKRPLDKRKPRQMLPPVRRRFAD